MLTGDIKPSNEILVIDRKPKVHEYVKIIINALLSKPILGMNDCLWYGLRHNFCTYDKEFSQS